jgi:hypothetical protein
MAPAAKPVQGRRADIEMAARDAESHQPDVVHGYCSLPSSVTT